MSFVSTCINPFYWRVYLELLRHIQTPLNTMIAEWAAPHPYHQIGIMIAILSIGITHFFTKVRITPMTILTGIFGLLSLSARHNQPLFYFSFILWLNDINIVHTYIYRFIKESAQKILLVYFYLFLLILSIPRITSTILTIFINTSIDEYCSLPIPKYPCKAITHIPAEAKNVYAAYEWGGFMIWKKPDVKVFVDGRMSAWKDSETHMYPYQTYLYIIQAQKGWNEILAKYNTDTLLIMQGTFLDLELQKNARLWGWKELYRDDVGVVYTKS